MRKYNLLYLSMIILLSIAPAVKAINIGVAATVQNREISEIRLQTAIDNYLSQQGTNTAAIRDPRRFKEIREKVLDVLISQELLWQAAYRDKTIASDDEVKQALKQYQAQFDDEVSFNLKIQEGGYNKTTFQDNLKQQLSAQNWIRKNVLKDVVVSESEVHAFYLDNRQQFIESEKIRARHILIKVKQEASHSEKDEAMQLLAAIRQQIDEGDQTTQPGTQACIRKR